MFLIDVALGHEDRIEASLRRNIDTGADRDLDVLLAHPRLGPLVKQLRVYAERPERVALALREEPVTRAQSGYIGPAGTLVIDVALGDEGMIAESLRRNIDAGTGLTSLTASGADRELDRLLVHPRLGPLVRQLQLYAERPQITGIGHSTSSRETHATEGSARHP